MANAQNIVIVTGRSAKDAQIYVNKDGSRKVLFSLVVERNFKNKNGEVGVDVIPMQAFLPKEKETNGVYEYVKQGTLMSVQATMRSDSYEKDGQKVFKPYIQVENIQLISQPRKKGEQVAENAADEEIIVEEDTLDMPF